MAELESALYQNRGHVFWNIDTLRDKKKIQNKGFKGACIVLCHATSCYNLRTSSKAHGPTLTSSKPTA